MTVIKKKGKPDRVDMSVAAEGSTIGGSTDNREPLTFKTCRTMENALDERSTQQLALGRKNALTMSLVRSTDLLVQWRAVELVCMSILHFWWGVAIGHGLDWLQRKMEQIPKDPREQRARATAYAFQVSFIVVLMTIGFVLSQRFLGYVYRVLWCSIAKESVKGSPDRDVDDMHRGFAMFFGMAWSSGTTLSKLQIVLGNINDECDIVNRCTTEALAVSKLSKG